MPDKDVERERFQKWWRTSLAYSDMYYEDVAWEAWRAALSRETAERELPPGDGICDFSDIHRTTPHFFEDETCINWRPVGANKEKL